MIEKSPRRQQERPRIKSFDISVKTSINKLATFATDVLKNTLNGGSSCALMIMTHRRKTLELLLSLRESFAEIVECFVRLSRFVADRFLNSGL